MKLIIKFVTVCFLCLFLNSSVFADNAKPVAAETITVEAEISGHFKSQSSEQTIKIITSKSEKDQDNDRVIVVSENGKTIFQSKSFLPCSTCLGINGGYVDLTKKSSPNKLDSFVISLESGAAEKEMLHYTFRFDEASKKFRLIGEDNEVQYSFCKEPFENISINYLTQKKVITKMKCTDEGQQDFRILKETTSKIDDAPMYFETMSFPFSN